MNSKLLTFSCALLSTALLPAARAQAAPGDLDPTFGTMGKTLTAFSNHPAAGLAAARQTDGKIVVAGYVQQGADATSKDFALVRYNADGSLDGAFGVGGKVTTDFNGLEDAAFGIVIQTDGKIVVCGIAQNSGESDFALARYQTNGTLDRSFGPDQTGKVQTVFEDINTGGTLDALALDLVIQSDKKLVVVGRAMSSHDAHFAVARYLSDGRLDGSFGTLGQLITRISGPSGSDIASTVALQGDGKILVGGTATTATDQDFALVRYDADGTMDGTFGSAGTGVVETDFNGGYDGIGSLALKADGTIIAAGSTTTIGPAPDYEMSEAIAVAKYDGEGLLDTTYGQGGKVTASFGSNIDADSLDLVLQPDGRAIVGGYSQRTGGDEDFALVRLLADGSLDSTFGTEGKVTTAISGGKDAIEGLILLPDGKLIAAGFGSVQGEFVIARYETGLIATKPLNLSTRADVGTGGNVLIGGFIITGTAPERVLLRAIGPSLASAGIQDPLANPVLELHEPDRTVITNDNWKDTQETEIAATNLAPSSNLESAIIGTFAPGAYTAIVSGKNGGTGVGLVEAYDLEDLSASELANVSTRGFIKTGNDVMIGGFIIGGVDEATVLVRGIGPSLTDLGVANALTDPTLEIHNANGAQIAFDDNWKDTQEDAIEATGLAPKDDREAAILMSLKPGAYTAIVRGKNGLTGVGLVETYNR